jgi:tRNA uridine 5-carboxymethylaminomethyl modification enzyme
MFTSRAEYRLSLRADNADQRLTSLGERAGAVGSKRAMFYASKRDRLDAARARLRELSLTPNQAQRHGIVIKLDGVRRSAAELLSFPDVTFAQLAQVWRDLGGLAPDVIEQLEIDAQYAGYLDRQEADIIAFRREEGLRIPADLDYAAVKGLSTEAGEKLELIRPDTLGQAARIDGITPAALTLVLAHVRAKASARQRLAS